jgi:hypothetical protein
MHDEKVWKKSNNAIVYYTISYLRKLVIDGIEYVI